MAYSFPSLFNEVLNKEKLNFQNHALFFSFFVQWGIKQRKTESWMTRKIIFEASAIAFKSVTSKCFLLNYKAPLSKWKQRVLFKTAPLRRISMNTAALCGLTKESKIKKKNSNSYCPIVAQDTMKIIFLLPTCWLTKFYLNPLVCYCWKVKPWNKY